ncbi:NUDIX hydrolase domain-like protein [Cubamyces menziesii]|nr:NUDIX hydrolase domain-like protein [Cubamyces menziesii]
MPGPTPVSPPQSFLQIVQSCDNFSVAKERRNGAAPEETLVPWLLSPSPTSPAVGLLRPEIVDQLRKEALSSDGSSRPDWFFGHDCKTGREWVSFADGISTPSARSRVMKDLCEHWRDIGLWPEEIGLRKWRNELYPVYRNPFGPRDYPSCMESDEDLHKDTLNYAFRMERAASGLFGVVTYGVHMTVYEEVQGQGGKQPTMYKIWVPRRAATKQTWPGYLDNSVAGGIEAGLGILDCVVKEAMEEASIPEDVVRRYARSAGTVSNSVRTSSGWFQPELGFVHDLCLPPGSGVQPQPLDGEVESFELLPLGKVIEYMRAGLFVDNSAIVLVDFMVRKGIIAPDNEPEYQEIVARLHGRFDYDMWTPQGCAMSSADE